MDPHTDPLILELELRLHMSSDAEERVELMTQLAALGVLSRAVRLPVESR